MSGSLEDTKPAEWAENDEARIEHIERPRTEFAPEHVEARGERGYMDYPDRSFRLEHPDEYLEPFDQASYRIEPFQDPHDTVGLVNPDYEPPYEQRADGKLGDFRPLYDAAEPYGVNCADASRCFERTWRGHAEEAAGRSWELSGQGMYVDGEPSARTAEWAGTTMDKIEDPAELRQALEDAGHGSSAIVHSQFLGEDGKAYGHAYNVVNFEDRIQVVDAQTQEVLPFNDAGIRPGIGLDSSHQAWVWDASGRRVHV